MGKHNKEFSWQGPISKRHAAMLAGERVAEYVDPVRVTAERRRREELRRAFEDRRLEKDLLGGDPYV